MKRLTRGKKRTELHIITSTVQVTYTGIYRVEGNSHPCLAYMLRAERPDGQARYINSAVEILRAGDLQRLQQEFRPGERIQLTMQTDWSVPSLVTTLLSFTKVANPNG